MLSTRRRRRTPADAPAQNQQAINTPPGVFKILHSDDALALDHPHTVIEESPTMERRERVHVLLVIGALWIMGNLILLSYLWFLYRREESKADKTWG